MARCFRASTGKETTWLVCLIIDLPPGNPLDTALWEIAPERVVRNSEVADRSSDDSNLGRRVRQVELKRAHLEPCRGVRLVLACGPAFTPLSSVTV